MVGGGVVQDCSHGREFLTGEEYLLQFTGFQVAGLGKIESQVCVPVLVQAQGGGLGQEQDTR